MSIYYFASVSATSPVLTSRTILCCVDTPVPVVTELQAVGAPVVWVTVGVHVSFPNVFTEIRFAGTFVPSIRAVLQAAINAFPCVFAAEMLALSCCDRNPGTATAESTPRITTTIRSSISVKPFCSAFLDFFWLIRASCSRLLRVVMVQRSNFAWVAPMAPNNSRMACLIGIDKKNS